MADVSEVQIRALDPEVQPLAVAMLTAAREAGYPMVIRALGGRRTREQQQRLVRARRSRTLDSKHLSGRAFDVDIAGLNRNRVPSWFWKMLGPWAEQQLGLTWGGRWRRPYDPGHFEL